MSKETINNGTAQGCCARVSLLASLFEEKAEKEKLYATLWQTDPERYGTDAEGIALQKGRAEAWKKAAELLKAQAG